MRSNAMAISAVAALATTASLSSARSPHGRPDGVAGWDTTSGDCPCSDAKLCEPITKPRSQEDVCELCIGTGLAPPAVQHQALPQPLSSSCSHSTRHHSHPARRVCNCG